MNEKFTKKVSFVLIILLFVLTLSFAALISQINYVYAYETDAGSILTSIREIELNAGETKVFTTDLLPDEKYCVVETRGDFDTYLIVQVGNNLLFDDNSGVGLNACIGFKWHGPLTIRVKLNNNQQGKVKLQFRTQQASLFGFDYGKNDINTKADALKVCEYLGDNYNALAYTDPSIFSNHIFLDGMPTVGYSRLNSEIFFFSGHGSRDGYVTYPPANYEDQFYCLEIENMENCKLAVWSACYSANTDNSFGTSMAHASVDAGARTAIGWKKKIPDSSSSTFNKRLFKKLSEGSTVESACNYAKNGIVWVWDNVRDYTIVGDKATTINASSIKKSAKKDMNVDCDEINKIINDDINWVSYDLGDGLCRFHRLVNGKISNVFYDINLEMGTIVNESNVKFENQKVLEPRISDSMLWKNRMINESDGGILVDSETYNVYCIIDNVAIPVEIKYCEYEKYGISYMKVICTNLNDGERIDYKDICEVEE